MATGDRDTLGIQAEVLLKEYDALYRLAEFRLAALDRRIPLIGSILTATLGSIPALPEQSQILGLLVIPVSLVWLLRTTINHARSFEDALRALEGLEGRLNGLLDVKLIGFQSTHPSRGERVGGRTGAETVYAVALAACLLLAMCLWMALGVWSSEEGLFSLYCGAIAMVACMLFVFIRGWSRYRYATR